MSIIKYTLGEIKNLYRLFTLMFDTTEPKLDYSSMPNVSEETMKILKENCFFENTALPNKSMRREITLTPKPTYRLFSGLHTGNIPKYYVWKFLPEHNITVYRKIVY